MMCHYLDEYNEIKTEQWNKGWVHRLWRYKLADFSEAHVQKVFSKLNHSQWEFMPRPLTSSKSKKRKILQKLSRFLK